MPVVMGMVSGVFLRFGLDLVYALRDDIWVAAPMTGVFLALSGAPQVARRLPPLVGAMIVGALALTAGGFHQTGGEALALARPNVYVPAFSWQAMIELVVPLAITVLVVQNGQGIALLRAAGHRPPINAITVACGGISMVTAFPTPGKSVIARLIYRQMAMLMAMAHPMPRKRNGVLIRSIQTQSPPSRF